uniref:Uncharacterized protein n=1 Tax=viral metagenome TaxID=1070528 RepID=A0A2V0RI68_9ZZZZ
MSPDPVVSSDAPLSEFHWSKDDYERDAASAIEGIKRARLVISSHMRGVAIEHSEEVDEIVGIIGNIVSDVHQMIMCCSMYHADSSIEHCALAILCDEMHITVWEMQADILRSRMHMLDSRRRYNRRAEVRGITLDAVETSFSYSMYLSTYERMLSSTCLAIRGASEWHHHMALMHDQITMAASRDASDIPSLMADDDDDEPETGDTTASSSIGTAAETLEEIVEVLSKPRSPIDV